MIIQKCVKMILMISTRKELKKFIKADFIMNYGEYSFKRRIICLLSGDLISKFLKQLRKTEYSVNKRSIFASLQKFRLKKISYKAGFSIALNVFDYGLVIPHHGTIVVGSGNKIGRFCVLHTSTCIGEGEKNIGDGFYLSAGAKVFKNITIANNVSIGSNSLVNKPILKANSLYAGVPALYIKESEPWYVRDGEKYEKRVKDSISLFNCKKR